MSLLPRNFAIDSKGTKLSEDVFPSASADETWVVPTDMIESGEVSQLLCNLPA